MDTTACTGPDEKKNTKLNNDDQAKKVYWSPVLESKNPLNESISEENNKSIKSTKTIDNFDSVYAGKFAEPNSAPSEIITKENIEEKVTTPNVKSLENANDSSYGYLSRPNKVVAVVLFLLLIFKDSF